MPAGNDVSQLLKQISGDSAAPTAASIDQLIRKRRVSFLRTTGATGANTDDAMANTTTAEQQLFYTSVAITITAFAYIPNGTITADAANQVTFTLSKRTSAGATQTTLATITSNVALGNLVAGQPAVGTLSATTTDLQVAAGSSIAITTTKPGTGVVARAGSFVIEYTED